MTIKILYLNLLLSQYLDEKNYYDDIWILKFKDAVKFVLGALSSMNEKDLNVKDFSNLEFIIKLAIKSDNKQLKSFLVNQPYINKDLSYNDDAIRAYKFLTNIKIIKKNKKLTFKYGKKVFKIKIDNKTMKFKFLYRDEYVLSDDIEDLIDFKNFIIENDISIKLKPLRYKIKKIFKKGFKNEFLEEIYEQFKIIKY